MVPNSNGYRFLGGTPRHRDPFDRMLIAQAQCESLALLTVDERLTAYGKNILWIKAG